ncbi:MAG: transglycosylase SLT domain-containing protein [Bacteroidaceae bacterium]|nr:transglycosylase SLT domain-containing protein [Bacteroidaceae bacterium]
MSDRRATEWALTLGVAAFLMCAIWTRHHRGLTPDTPHVGDGTTVLYDTVITLRKAPPFTISPYDAIFRRYADSLRWDWKWLAAVAYNESRFHADAVNPSGATGLMQLMPRTAVRMGVDSLSLTNPHMNVKAAARLFKRLDAIYSSSAMPDRACMVLAAYNAGAGHVNDAALLTEKYGGNRKQWYGNVEYFIQMLREPKYYNDPVCTGGKFNAGETTRFVRNVFDKYMEYSRLEHLYNTINHADTIIVEKKIEKIED